jgi:hypothetical protein
LKHISSYNVLDLLLFSILHNHESCGADGLLGNAHDAADVAGVLAHLVVDEEEGFPNRLLLSRKLFVPLQQQIIKR